MSPERSLVWADKAYFGMAIVAAIATALTIVAGIAQNRLSARISDAKDRAFADFKLTTENQALALRAEVANANARAAEANKIAEQERLARLRIEANLASRRLKPEQVAMIAASLRGSLDVMPRVRLTLLGDQEAKEYGFDVVKALELAGIQVEVSRVGVMTPPPYGLQVTDNPSGSLRSAFTAAGVNAEYAPSTFLLPNVVVGLKPPAF